MLDKKDVKADLRGGFLARTLFVPYTSKDFEMDTPGEVDRQWESKLIGFAKSLGELHPVRFEIDSLGELRHELKRELDKIA